MSAKQKQAELFYVISYPQDMSFTEVKAMFENWCHSQGWLTRGAVSDIKPGVILADFFNDIPAKTGR